MTLLTIERKKSSNGREAASTAWSGEAVAFCPRCKALQTVWFSRNMLMPTRKYSQEGAQIFHDCGSDQPCRLYHAW